LDKISKQIVFEKSKNEKKSDKIGGFYDLFESEMFDIHYAICYLDNKQDPGIQDTLMNIIYKRFIDQSFFYLPQLW
jgi:hypothetical protein